MNLHSPSGGRYSARRISLIALLSAILVTAQIALSFLPNIELVSLLIILYTSYFKRESLTIIGCFILIEAAAFGFGIWLINYTYIWYILWASTAILNKFRLLNHFSATCLNAVFGLLYGAFCAIPYIFMGGLDMALSYWISGIPFDLLHFAGNLVTAAVLYRPLRKCLDKCPCILCINGGHNGR